MLIDTTSQLIRAHIEGAPTTTNPVFTTTYADITATTFVAAESNGALNGVTEVSVVASPAASTARHVKEIQIYNADTVQHTITVDFFDGTNTLIYGKFVVPASQFLRYSPDTGWQIGVGVGVGTGTVSSVALTGSAIFSITGSPITSAGTFDIEFANQTDGTLFSNISGSPAAPTFNGLSAILDHVVGNTRGGIITRTATGWTLLAPSATAGFILSSNGTGADLSYIAAPATGVTSVALTAPVEFTVGGSPITGAGTLMLSWANENANLVFAGPSSGSPATPGFRSLVAADIPALSYVTSVSMTVPSRQTVTGSPITSSGTFAITDNNQNANLVFAGPSSGGAAAPAFRALVAGDIPSLSGTYLALAGGTMTGQEMLADGSASTPGLSIHSADTGLYYEPSDPSGTLRPIAFAVAGKYMVGISGSGLNVQGSPGAGAQVAVKAEGATTNSVERVTASANSPVYLLNKSRGTVAAPAIIQTNDQEGNIQFRGGASVSGQTITYVAGAQIGATCIDTTPSATAMGSRLIFSACAIGASVLTEIGRLDTANGLSMFGANIVIDANRVFRNHIFTVATLPSGVAGMRTLVSDALAPTFGAAVVGGGAVTIPVYFDTGWKVG